MSGGHGSVVDKRCGSAADLEGCLFEHIVDNNKSMVGRSWSVIEKKERRCDLAGRLKGGRREVSAIQETLFEDLKMSCQTFYFHESNRAIRISVVLGSRQVEKCSRSGGTWSSLKKDLGCIKV